MAKTDVGNPTNKRRLGSATPCFETPEMNIDTTKRKLSFPSKFFRRDRDHRLVIQSLNMVLRGRNCYQESFRVKKALSILKRKKEMF